MLRKWLELQLSLAEKGKPLHRFRTLINATDTFLYEAKVNTSHGPHIRDAIDVKRWMLIVVYSLIPCILWSIWNTGVQSFIYSSANLKLMEEYLTKTTSFQGYLDFVMKEGRFLTIIKLGSLAFFPLVLITYVVGGLCEALFAHIRGHEISEGFLVTGILYVLILPSTIPYWMAAVGISAGIILSKEVFGGSGMNIVNPALASRAFLFFTFPGRMSGEIWAGTNPTTVRQSLVTINQEAQAASLDGISQATKLAQYNITQEIKRIHVDAIASNRLGDSLSPSSSLQTYFDNWKLSSNIKSQLGELTPDQLRSFVTSPRGEAGLGLSPGYYDEASQFSNLNYGIGHNSDWGFFFGDKLGSMGETSIFCILLGAIFLIWTGVGSWRTMTAMLLGAFFTAFFFEAGTHWLGAEGGLWNPATSTFPAYKHLLLGGLAFGIVFMATDPVSSPSMNGAKWIYGIFCGVVTIVIRVINPAYPEGAMLAILMGNCFAPLFDYYVSLNYRKRSLKRARSSA